MKNRKYYSLAVQFEKGDNFAVQFGDFDKDVVKQEIEDSYSDCFKCKIICTDSNQESIVNAINLLNLK